jgi:hypothetical protein
MHPKHLAFLPLLLVTACARPPAAPAAAVPAGETPATATTFRMEPYRSTVALRGVVGGVPGRFVFDTGAGSLHVTPRFAQRMGCKPWGRLSGYTMMHMRLDSPRCDGTRIEIDGHALATVTAGVLDVMSFYPEGAEPVDGLMGLDMFAGRTITIDFPKGELVVETPASLRARLAGATEVPARLTREMQGRTLAVSIEVPTPSGGVMMELDSGNGGTILVAKPYAEALGLDPAVEGEQQARFDVAPGFPARGRAFTPDMLLEGNLGMPFLKDKAVTLDLAAGRAWLAHADTGLSAAS